jgi:hypothetical protein
MADAGVDVNAHDRSGPHPAVSLPVVLAMVVSDLSIDMVADDLYQMHHLAEWDIVADKANIVHRPAQLAFVDFVVAHHVAVDMVQVIDLMVDTVIVPSRYLTSEVAVADRWADQVVDCKASEVVAPNLVEVRTVAGVAVAIVAMAAAEAVAAATAFDFAMVPAGPAVVAVDHNYLNIDDDAIERSVAAVDAIATMNSALAFGQLAVAVAAAGLRVRVLVPAPVPACIVA